FLAGPREDRPSAEVLAAPDADVNAPRPANQELPFEYFAYDEKYSPLSSAGARFPQELRDALMRGPKTVVMPFVTRDGTGVQEAVHTEWAKSPCQVLLFRLRPVPHQSAERFAIFLGLAVSLILVALV